MTPNKQLSDVYLKALPGELRAFVINAWKTFHEHPDAKAVTTTPSFLTELIKVWAVSPWVAENCVREPQLLEDLQSSGDLDSADRRIDYARDLAHQLELIDSEIALMQILRRFRNREMIRIAWRDIAAKTSIDETLLDLSALAEGCLQTALDWLYEQACRQKSTPLLENGDTQRPVVLAMGKLGAWELNFSSDIDLIFAYPEDGTLMDKQETSYAEFFTRICQKLVRILDAVIEGGFVFRVDTRLRPYGASGPLIISFDAMESYYQSQAREWERYAMIKARPVAGDLTAGEKLQEILRPFVYRRYLDYSTLAELRELKRKITLDLQRKDRTENVKLSPGGIREIEFIGQAFQLIRGGRDKTLQQRQIINVLQTLDELDQLPTQVVEKLVTGYRFLRQVENRIQQYGDRQTHELPVEANQRLSLAFGCGFDDWDSFKDYLDKVRDDVHGAFQQVFESPQSDSEPGDADLVWNQNDDETRWQAATHLGYDDAHLAIDVLDKFRGAGSFKRLTAKGAESVDRLIPLILGAAVVTENKETTLQRILDLIEAIASRQTYLSLLVENPLALSQLVKLAAASPWILAYIAAAPLLLDELLDPRTLYSPPTKQQLQGEIDQRIHTTDLSDLEYLMSELRHFKQSNVLRVAAADISGVIPLMIVSDHLTEIAEIVVDKVLALAWTILTDRHGPPPDAKNTTPSGFSIIGYGKLGGIELGYGSDLDLVFLHDNASQDQQTTGEKPIDCAQFYARLGQRIIAIMNTKMLSGALYDIDMRLRPSGNAGLLVSTLGAFEAYQNSQAWTWEHQALIRARFIAGDSKVADRFKEIRDSVLTKPRQLDTLRNDVVEMREKMRRNLAAKETGVFDLKQGIGGIGDIEFIVQFGVLSLSNTHQKLVEYTDNVRLLEELAKADFIVADEATLLKNAYCEFRDRTHRAALENKKAVVAEDEYRDLRAGVAEIWQKLLG